MIERSFITIDFEGDASSRRSTFDRDTIPWCFTACRSDGETLTYCTKLIETVESIARGAVHHRLDTKIPHTVLGSRPVIEVDSPIDLVVEAANLILRYSYSGNTALFKAYWDPVTKKSFFYDRELMRICLDRYDLGSRELRDQVLSYMVGVQVKRDGYGHEYGQVQHGEYIPPDEFVKRGIEHNIADAWTLAKNVFFRNTFSNDPNYTLSRHVHEVPRYYHR